MQCVRYNKSLLYRFICYGSFTSISGDPVSCDELVKCLELDSNYWMLKHSFQGHCVQAVHMLQF